MLDQDPKPIPEQKTEVHKPQELQAQETTPYDAVLALESLGDFLHTGHIKFLQKAESTFKASAEERYKIVSIVGFPAHWSGNKRSATFQLICLFVSVPSI